VTMTSKRTVLVVGLVGGIASGKSSVAEMLGEMGAQVLDADRINHEVLRQPEVVEEVVEQWGPDVLDGQGQVDRKKLADKVFEADDAVKKLESIVHPDVCRRIERAVEVERSKESTSVVVIDAPLLVEAGLDGQCDRIVYVDAPEAVRVQRVLADRGWDRKELCRRESHQKSLSYKRNHADIVITNGHSTGELRKQVERLWDELSRLLSQ